MPKRPGTSGVWRGRVFTLCSAVSLLSCLGAFGMGIRSRWVAGDLVMVVGGGAAGTPRPAWFDVTSENGGLGISVPDRGTVWTLGSDLIPYGRFWYKRTSPPPADAYPAAGVIGRAVPWHGFIVACSKDWPGYYVTVPYWAAALAAAVLPAAWARHALIIRRRSATNRCPACGYDLRASPTGCPECGAGRTAA